MERALHLPGLVDALNKRNINYVTSNGPYFCGFSSAWHLMVDLKFNEQGKISLFISLWRMVNDEMEPWSYMDERIRGRIRIFADGPVHRQAVFQGEHPIAELDGVLPGSYRLSFGLVD